jgi:PAS domain S-box-containing protein
LFPTVWTVRPRQIAPVALVLGLTIVAFVGVRLLGERGARRDSQHRAEVAAAQIRTRVDEGASLAESLRRFMVSVPGTGVTSDEFASNASRWLSPAGFPAAAWVEQVPASRRATYERRLGLPIVTFDRRLRIVPVGPRSSYLPMVLVSGIPPATQPGVDLGGEPGMAAALARARRFDDTRATPMTTLPDGSTGFFLVSFAPRLTGAAVKPGFVVMFVSAPDLLTAAAGATPLQLTAGGTSAGDLGARPAVHSTFTEAGQRFRVAAPQIPLHGAMALLPWIILAAGLVLAALAGALGVTAARRARAKAEVDRIFRLSADLITVTGFDGFWKRVNPAFKTLLGYTEREALARPYLEFVHPDDRERSEAETLRLLGGQTIVAFENRLVGKDGSHRWIEWTATPVLEEGLHYGVGRDVTDRRQAEAELERLAGVQAALRRVATLVAREASQAEVFRAIAEGIGRLLGTEEMRMLHYDGDRSAVVVANSGDQEVFAVGSRYPLNGDNAASRVFRTGRPARIDDYGSADGPFAEAARAIGICSVVGAPILVEGRLWGAMIAGTGRAEPLPPETESRLGQFTELMAIAIANAAARAEVERLAEEQAALRRVATLVAEGAVPTTVFDAVAAEMEGLLDADEVTLSRYEPDGELVLLAHRGANAQLVPPGARVRPEDESVTATVRRTEHPARRDEYPASDGSIAQFVQTGGAATAVGAPIVVDGRLWGVVVATWDGDESPPANTEERMGQFAQLLDTATANADGREQLTASRARLLTAADEARRRVVRDLHDGAQQRLVQAILTLKLARQALREDEGTAEAFVTEALEHTEQGNTELRELAHGILPSVITHGGLRAGIRSVVRRLDLPVEVDVPAERWSAEIEASAYFVAAEALTNVVKHSNATRAEVTASVEGGVLQVEVRDDGMGGADPDGHGLVGMDDRVSALGGRLKIDSPPGGGTLVAATLPLSAR